MIGGKIGVAALLHNCRFCIATMRGSPPNMPMMRASRKFQRAILALLSQRNFVLSAPANRCGTLAASLSAAVAERFNGVCSLYDAKG
jgi:hypothetical protein